AHPAERAKLARPRQHGALAGDLEILEAVVANADADRAVAVSGLEIFLPEVGRLEDVPIAVDDHRACVHVGLLLRDRGIGSQACAGAECLCSRRAYLGGEMWWLRVPRDAKVESEAILVDDTPIPLECARLAAPESKSRSLVEALGDRSCVGDAEPHLIQVPGTRLPDGGVEQCAAIAVVPPSRGHIHAPDAAHVALFQLGFSKDTDHADEALSIEATEDRLFLIGEGPLDELDGEAHVIFG